MGMQVSRGVDTEVSEEELVRGVTEVFGINIPRARHAKRESGDRRASFARSCTRADLDTTEVCGGTGRGLFERQKCDSHRPRVHGSEEKLYGSAFLGPWVLCIDRWHGRGDDPRVHPATGAGRSSPGSDDDV